MGKTATVDRVLECHPCGTSTQYGPQVLGLLYYTAIVYYMCFMTPD